MIGLIFRASYWLLPGLLGLTGCMAHRDASREALARAVREPPGILVLGEIHGTREVPAYFTNLAEYLSSRGEPLTVGLEMPAETVRAGCSAAAAADVFWTRVRDGRSSEAVWQMLCRLKALERAGRVRLFGFAAPRGPGPGHPFAGPVAAALGTSDRGLLLVGNFHARRSSNSLVQDLAGRGIRVFSLTISSGPGTAWTCDREGDCRARPLNPDFCGGSTDRPAYVADRWTAAATGALWDACLAFPTLTASPPHRP